MSLSLFIPCYVEQLRPQAGLATARLLEHLGLDWNFPEHQTCCGQLAFNAGHARAALPAARRFLRLFTGDASAPAHGRDDRPRDIVAPSGSCVAMVRRYHELPGLDDDERRALRELGARCFELCEYLVRHLGRIELGATWRGRVAFQDCCHSQRDLGLREEPRALLKAVAGLDLIDQAETECCGFGGVYSVKVPETSIAQADERLALLREAETDTLVATDVSCLLHLQARADHLGQKLRTLHIAEILAPAAIAGAGE